MHISCYLKHFAYFLSYCDVQQQHFCENVPEKESSCVGIYVRQFSPENRLKAGYSETCFCKFLQVKHLKENYAGRPTCSEMLSLTPFNEKICFNLTCHFCTENMHQCTIFHIYFSAHKMFSSDISHNFNAFLPFACPGIFPCDVAVFNRWSGLNSPCDQQLFSLHIFNFLFISCHYYFYK